MSRPTPSPAIAPNGPKKNPATSKRVIFTLVGGGVPTIKPNQIRHTHGTRVEREYEDDRAVVAALGSSTELARQVYVDNPGDAVAMRIAETLG